jgi:hypothetical protein
MSCWHVVMVCRDATTLVDPAGRVVGLRAESEPRPVRRPAIGRAARAGRDGGRAAYACGLTRCG